MVWTCLWFIRYGQNHLARHSERGKKRRQTEKEVRRQHQGMDRSGVRQAPEGSGEQWKMEEIGCEVICGAQWPLRLRSRWSWRWRKINSTTVTCSKFVDSMWAIQVSFCFRSPTSTTQSSSVSPYPATPFPKTTKESTLWLVVYILFIKICLPTLTKSVIFLHIRLPTLTRSVVFLHNQVVWKQGWSLEWSIYICMRWRKKKFLTVCSCKRRGGLSWGRCFIRESTLWYIQSERLQTTITCIKEAGTGVKK